MEQPADQAFEYDRQVAVVPDDIGGYVARLAPGWVVGGGVNGGYLLGVLGSALRTALPGKPDPLAVSAHFLSASVPGPAVVRVDVRREGGSVAVAAVDLVQDGVTRIHALATCGDLVRFADRADAADLTFADKPTLPPPDECPSSRDAPSELKAFIPMLDRFDLRLDPAHAAWHGGRPAMGGVIQGWFRLADGREPDVISLLTVCDVLPPVTMDLGLPGWAPTLELTAHVRARPAPGWLTVRHAATRLTGGIFDETCEIWDATGHLVAQSRQLALQPRG